MNNQFIGLIQVIKKPYSYIFRNENFGFLLKSVIVSGLILFLCWMPLGLGIVVMNGLMFSPNEKNVQITNNVESNIDISGTPANTTPTQEIQADELKQGLFFMAMFLIVIILGGILYTNLTMIPVIKVYEGNLISMKELVRMSFRKYFPMMGLVIIQALVVQMGFLLFVIPGIILAIMFMFAPYILLAENCGPIEALKRSKALTSGYLGNLFLKYLGFLGLLILFGIPLLLVVAVVMYSPGGILISYIATFWMYLIFIVMYKDLKRIKDSVTLQTTPETPTQVETIKS